MRLDIISRSCDPILGITSQAVSNHQRLFPGTTSWFCRSPSLNVLNIQQLFDMSFFGSSLKLAEDACRSKTLLRWCLFYFILADFYTAAFTDPILHNQSWSVRGRALESFLIAKGNTGSNMWVSSVTLRKMALILHASILYNDVVYQYIALLCQIVNKVKISENDWTNGYIGRNLTQKKRITTDDLTARGNSLTGRTFRIGTFPAP